MCSLVVTTVVMCSGAFAQDPATVPQFRSRSEHLAESRKVETAFPDLVRALRTLHLPPDKMNQAEAKLRRSEVETRPARQELQSLLQKQQGQDYERRSGNSSRVAELRTSLQALTDQLHSEIKGLLTQQQRDQLNRHLQRQTRERGSHSANSRR